MIFADINWLDITINLLLVVFVIVCLLMALLILMQRPKQEGLGAAFGGGVTDQVFGARTTNVLQRGTVYLGSMFFILALTLAILIGKQTKKPSLLDTAKPADKVETSKKSDTVEEPKSLANELPVDVTTPPATEVAPPVEQPAPPVEQPAPPVEQPAPPVETPVAPAEGGNDADKTE